MITEEQHRGMIAECNTWYTQLASYSAKLKKLQAELYFFAPGKTDKDVLIGIEHYHSQFHIQLINIHDLKHEIRYHVNEAEKHPDFGHRIPHHNIKEKLDTLLSDIDKLDQDFHKFITG
ncbi:MAG: hypothetical protein IPP48_04850 [Chitinophagaceae bacterium]|nr:hypothetical protein [Chitinophagaceae bacterium]